MQLELLSASNFLVHLIRMARRSQQQSTDVAGSQSSQNACTESQLAKFRESLMEVLQRRYRDHWFPEKPFKGSGYRCIRINGKMDSVIGKAGEDVGLSSDFLHKTFPGELTMWIDPKEVSYRIGENGSICILYEQGSDGTAEAWNPPALSGSSSVSAGRSSPPAADKKAVKREVKPMSQQSSPRGSPPLYPTTTPFAQPNNNLPQHIIAPNVVNSNKNLVRNGQQHHHQLPQQMLQQFPTPPALHHPQNNHHQQQQQMQQQFQHQYYMMNTCNKEANSYRAMEYLLSMAPGSATDPRKTGHLSIEQLAAFVSS